MKVSESQMSLKSLGEYNSRILDKGKEYGTGRIMSPHVFCKDRLATNKLVLYGLPNFRHNRGS